MIFVAAAVIMVSAVDRFLQPAGDRERRHRPGHLGRGLGRQRRGGPCVLLRAGRAHRSVTLTADGKHLMTDVWTSVGVVVGVLLVALTGWRAARPGRRRAGRRQHPRHRLPARLAVRDLAAGRRAARGGPHRLTAVLDRLRTPDVDFAHLRTRESGQHRFVSLTLLVPGSWTVERAHDVADDVEAAIAADLTGTDVETHIEPRVRRPAGTAGDQHAQERPAGPPYR